MPDDATARRESRSWSTPPARAEGDIHLTLGVFENFRSGVIDLHEQGEELVVTREVWVDEELVVTTQVTERTVVVRDVVRRIDVDVEPLLGRSSDPL